MNNSPFKPVAGAVSKNGDWDHQMYVMVRLAGIEPSEAKGKRCILFNLFSSETTLIGAFKTL